MQKRWITPRECAEYLSLNVKTIYAQAATGIIPSAKIGGSVRIDKKKLDEQLENQILDLESIVKDLI